MRCIMELKLQCTSTIRNISMKITTTIMTMNICNIQNK